VPSQPGEGPVVAVAAASSAVAAPAEAADPAAAPEAGPPVAAATQSPGSPEAPPSVDATAPTGAVEGDLSGASPPEAGPPVEAGTAPSGVPDATGGLSVGAAGVALPQVQLSLDAGSADSVALAVAMSVVQTPAGPSAAGPRGDPTGPTSDAPTAPSPPPVAHPPGPGGSEVGTSVEPTRPWSPEIELSLDGQSTDSVAVAVAIAVVQEMFDSAVVDQSMAVAVSVAAM
jgi:hypothetical protein